MRAPWLLGLAALALLAACPRAGTRANQPPTARILSPRDGATLPSGAVTLMGEVSDAEDGALPSGASTWSSDRDGVLGNGPTVSTTLTAGAHRLSLDVRDSRGLEARAQVTVTVTGTTGASDPVATIIEPRPGAFFDQGQPITLRGSALDAEDGPIGGAALAWSSSVAGALGTGEQVVFTGAALGAHRIVLTATDRSGRSGYAAVDITIVRPGTNRPPSVRIVAPAEGAQLTVGQAVTLTAEATDAEDGVLTGGSVAWISSRDGFLGNGASLSRTLTQGVHTLMVAATDSLGATGFASVTVSVNSPGNRPPTVAISSPSAGLTVFQGTVVMLAGTASDPEDGPLSGAALMWSSSRDGVLGTGSPRSESGLSAGDHVLTLVATDSGGSAGTASVMVRVLPQNNPPTVAITAPADSTSVPVGTSLVFTGTASDAEDGALAGSALVWCSSLDGTLGTGPSLTTASLSVGQHTVTLTATDSGGRSASASISVTIRPAPVNVPPIARLTGPTQGTTGQALTFDGSTSSDSDGAITTWSFDFGDGTAAQSGAQTTAMHTYATPGDYIVRLTVTDNQSATGTTALTLTVAQAVRVPVVADASNETHGRVCRLSAVGTTLHVAWYSSLHPTLWYATWDGATLSREVVDGFGFNFGGEVEPNLSLQLDGQGRPHLAYTRDGQVFYANKSAAGWIRERISTTSFPFYGSGANAPGIGLDPSQAERPTVVYTTAMSSAQRIVVATRGGAAAWSLATPVFGGFTTIYDQGLRGDVVFDTAGRLLLPTYLSGAGGGGSGYYLASWTPSSQAAVMITALALGNSASLAWAGPNRLYVMTASGLLDVQVESPLGNTTARASLVETSNTSQYTVAADGGGGPRVLVNHGSTLEHVQPGGDGFWERLDLGATDDAVIDAVVDADGETRVCFFRAGKLVLY